MTSLNPCRKLVGGVTTRKGPFPNTGVISLFKATLKIQGAECGCGNLANIFWASNDGNPRRPMNSLDREEENTAWVQNCLPKYKHEC